MAARIGQVIPPLQAAVGLCHAATPAIRHAAAAIVARKQADPGTAWADRVGYSGVLLSVIGAVAAAPGAVPRLVRDIAAGATDFVNAIIRRIRRLFGKPQPIVGSGGVGLKPMRVNADIAFDVHASGTTKVRLERLERAVDHLNHLDKDRKTEIRALTAALEKEGALLKQEIKQIRSAMTDKDKESEKIDANALPLVAAGILIAGIPGIIAKSTTVAIVVIVIALALSVFGVCMIGSAIWSRMRSEHADTDRQQTPADAG